MVEYRHAHLERYRHACAINFRQDVIGKVSRRIKILHSCNDIWNMDTCPFVPCNRAVLVRTFNESFRCVPMADKRTIKRILASTQRLSKLVRLLTKMRRTAAGGEHTRHCVPETRRQCAKHAAHRLAQDRRAPKQRPTMFGSKEIARITAKQLIAAIARKSHADMPLGQLRNEICRNLRRVRKRLIID